MTDAPDSGPDLKSIAAKRIAGIPVGVAAAALAAGIVGAVVLRRYRSGSTTADSDTTTTYESTVSDVSADQGSAALGLYSASSPAAAQPLQGGAIEDNDQWARLALEQLIAGGANPYTAQQALTKYLDGEQLTFAEQALVDQAIRKTGVPPMAPALAPAPLPIEQPATPATAPTATPTPAPAASNPAPRTVTVQKGDTLSSIAKRVGTTWPKLYAANVRVIGPNPNLIKPGQVLTIP